MTDDELTIHIDTLYNKIADVINNYLNGTTLAIVDEAQILLSATGHLVARQCEYLAIIPEELDNFKEFINDMMTIETP